MYIITGQGMKRCSFVPLETFSKSHVSASRDALRLQLTEERSLRVTPSPSQRVFERTLALYATLRDTGCPFPPQEPTFYTPQEARTNARRDHTPIKAKRGHCGPATCDGRIVLRHSERSGDLRLM